MGGQRLNECWPIASHRQKSQHCLPLFTFAVLAFYVTETTVPSSRGHGQAIEKRPP